MDQCCFRCTVVDCARTHSVYVAVCLRHTRTHTHTHRERERERELYLPQNNTRESAANNDISLLHVAFSSACISLFNASVFIRVHTTQSFEPLSRAGNEIGLGNKTVRPGADNASILSFLNQIRGDISCLESPWRHPLINRR